ncbi:MAG: anti-sigma F factor [Clostridia bacterium]|jgi:stage II sporulation protein AB (anti-sigma F factor)|nr:anti-sigma F factor [Clostridia bacterium]MBQ5838274.1 anti-sigma F factor [Clostridia bacterium]
MNERVINTMKIEFAAKSVNESFARSAVAAFAALNDPSVSVIADIKTVVSEAVTNAIVHGYAGFENKQECIVSIVCRLTEDGRIIIRIKDKGRGIEDIHTAMQPLYTTDPENERSGMGFTVMQSFTDGLRVRSSVGKGTTVTLEKRLKRL